MIEIKTVDTATDVEIQLFTTKNDLPETTRVQIIELCNARLADAIDLQTQCKQAHWNVKGANFIALHELFDKVTESVEGYVDLLAERVVQLGGYAEGTARMAARRSHLGEYDSLAVDSMDHVMAMASVLAEFCKLTRRAIAVSGEFSDAGTADIFTEISRGVDKWLWMVEAHLPPER